MRLDGPDVARPADVATERPVVGEGAVLYPDAFPHAGGPDDAERGLAGPGDRRGARRAARPRAALPAPSRRRRARDAQAGLVSVRAATDADVDAIAASEADNLGADAWSHGLVAEGVAGPAADRPLPRRRGRGRRGRPRGGERGRRRRRAAADRGRLRLAAPGAWPERLLDEVVALAVRRTATGCCSRCARTTTAALAFYAAQGFVELDRRPPLLPRRRHRRRPGASCEDGAVSEPLVLGIETSCDETGVGHRPRRTPCWPTRWRRSVEEHARFGGVVPEVASRAHLEAMVPTIERRLRDAGVAAARRRRDRGHQRARPGRRAAGRRRRRQGARARAGQAAVRRQPPGRARRRRPARARPAARARAWRCWSRGGHSSLLLVEDVTARRRAARRHHRRRGRRGVRQGGPAARPAVPGRPAHRPGRARRRPGAHRLPARADRPPGPGAAPLRLLVLRAEDRGRPLGRGARARRRAGAGAPTSRRRSRRRSCDVLTRKARRRRAEPGRRRPADRRRRGGQLAAAGDGRGAVPPRPASGCACRGRGCAPTTARWSPRSAPSWSPRGRTPSALDLPADCSQPVTTVLV